MTNKTFNFFSLYKAGLLWLAVIAFNVTGGVDGVCASDIPAVPTVAEIVESAKNYMADRDLSFTDKIDNLILPEKDRSALAQTLFNLRDGEGNTLLHKFVSQQFGSYWLVQLLRITGMNILSVGNKKGEKPLSALSLKGKIQLFEGLIKSEDGEFSTSVYAYIQANEFDVLKADADTLIREIKDVESRFPDQFSHERQQAGLKKRDLSAIVRLCPFVLEGQKLEEFQDYFIVLGQFPKGIELLRRYRVDGTESLLEYYARKRKTGDWKATESLSAILRGYFENNIPISSSDWNIIELDYDLRHFIFTYASSVKAVKDFLLRYRNSRGENFTQLIMSADDMTSESSLSRLREKIDDDKGFLKLLNDAAPGAEAAVRMIEKQGWGQDFLENIDPTILVKVGPFGVTTLMKRALRVPPDAFSKTLADLKRRGVHGVDAKDSFGNTAQSISELVASMGYVNITRLLQVSMERRPLQGSLWSEIVNFPYREMPVRSYDFIDGALRVAYGQPQTPLHDAFFQRNVTNNRAEANALWRSLFNTYDGLVDAEMGVDKEEGAAGRYRGPPIMDRQSGVYEERDLPLVVRYLSTVSRDATEISPEEANRIANVLVGYSTFGIAFSRKVTHPEATIVVRNIRAVVKSLERALKKN